MNFVKIELPKEIKTEFFHIEIKYSLLRDGNIQAALSIVKSPKNVDRVISENYRGSSRLGYSNYVSIDRKDVISLSINLNEIIDNTKTRIEDVEKNIKALEFNNILCEMSS